MDAKRFNEVFADTVERSSSVLVRKADEYADDIDRLRNFKQSGHLQDETPIEALGGMMAKHTVSIYDYINLEELPSLAEWDEKIIDHINYLILLRALVVEATEGA